MGDRIESRTEVKIKVEKDDGRDNGKKDGSNVKLSRLKTAAVLVQQNGPEYHPLHHQTTPHPTPKQPRPPNLARGQRGHATITTPISLGSFGNVTRPDVESAYFSI